MENFKITMKEFKETNRKVPHIHGVEELILGKMVILPKPPVDSMQSLARFQWLFFKNKNRKIHRIGHDWCDLAAAAAEKHF